MKAWVSQPVSYLGQLEGTLGWWSAAIKRLEAARQANLEMEAIPFVAQVEAALAHALVQRRLGGDLDRAENLRDSANTTWDSLGLPHRKALIGGSVNVGVPAEDCPTSPLAEPRFRREGTRWRLDWRGRTTYLPHARGLSILAHLISHPGRRFHVTELVPIADEISSLGEVAIGRRLTTQERQSLDWGLFWRRLHQHEWERDSANRSGHRRGVELNQAEIDELLGHLKQKQAEVETIRKRIWRNVQTVYDNLAGSDLELKVHLSLTVHLGEKDVDYDPSRQPA